LERSGEKKTLAAFRLVVVGVEEPETEEQVSPKRLLFTRLHGVSL
jgi:hypothetical protein